MNNKKEVLKAIREAKKVTVWVVMNDGNHWPVFISKKQARLIVNISDDSRDIEFSNGDGWVRLGRF